jgi:signal transduction histidine kinase/ActR/RegA family two-component response regulator
MSTDSDLIRAEPHKEIALFLQRDVELLIERWSRRAMQEQPHASRSHHAALLDHIADLLHALARSLAESDPADTSQHCLPATVHGETRWEIGWSLPEVVRDYQILRLVILDYLDEVIEISPASRAVMAIGLALDESIAASVTMYVSSREAHLRQLEEERAERERQIQEFLRQRAESLREVDRRKNEFMSTLGHEMRNPLAPLSHSVRLLELNNTQDPVLAEVRNIISRQVQQLERLADDLLDVSRVAQGKIELRKAPTDLTVVARQAVETSKPHLDARKHHFEIAFPDEPVWVEGDALRLVQVVVNLLNNSAKYTEPGGQVRLAVERDERSAIVRVVDNGIGIPQDLLPHVFELFTQGDRSGDHSQGGMGIGLALVRRLVELHGGTITVESAGLGKGSEFVVRLPLIPAQPIDDIPAVQDGHSLSAAEYAVAGQYRILVVDDNVDVARCLNMLLSRDGHNVRVAYDGPSALDAANAFRPEVVLLDIGLPRMSGYDVAQRLRRQSGMEEAFLVALTGYGQDDDRQRANEAGFDAHFVKPMDLNSLREVMTRLKSTKRDIRR